MKRKIALLSLLSLSAAFIVSCSDDGNMVKVDRRTATCGYMAQQGVLCNNPQGTGGTVSTTTRVETVTVIQTGS